VTTRAPARKLHLRRQVYRLNETKAFTLNDLSDFYFIVTGAGHED
jgi:hypothetical protein